MKKPLQAHYKCTFYLLSKSTAYLDNKIISICFDRPSTFFYYCGLRLRFYTTPLAKCKEMPDQMTQSPVNIREEARLKKAQCLFTAAFVGSDSGPLS